MSKKKSVSTPVFQDKREILGENLFVKVSEILVDQPTDVISKITGILLDSGENVIYRLLQDENFLRHRINESSSHLIQLKDEPVERKEEAVPVEDLLYDAVRTVEEENCSKITGMILELDSNTIKTLLQNRDKLLPAVEKAKLAIENSDKDVIGEDIFQEIDKIYPEYSEKITGMLLEMETKKLKELIQDKQLLRKCIDKAYAALNKVS